MVYSQVGYCACGREIWIEFLFDGKRWSTRFQDAEQGDVERCPGCGQVLDADELEGV